MSMEKKIENEILDYLNRQPDVLAWKNNSTGIYDPKAKTFRKKSRFDINGVPDVLVLSKFGFFAIEVKTPETIGDASDEQKAFLRKAHRLGIPVSVCCSLSEAVIFWESIKNGSIVGRNEERWL